jgi:hypothetical protein
LFIIKRVQSVAQNLVVPFIESGSREKARANLLRLRDARAIEPQLYKALFTKGLINNVPEDYR